MIKYDDVHPSLRNFIGTFELLRKAGFSNDDIYCEVTGSIRLGGRLGVMCVLRSKGKQFSVECGPIDDIGGEEACAQYKRYVAAQNSKQVDPVAVERMYKECEAFNNKAGFFLAIMTKGIPIPASQPEIYRPPT